MIGILRGFFASKQSNYPDNITIDINGKYCGLSRNGKRGDYLGLCPFHREFNPSFIYNINSHKYHCFGCQADGTAVALKNRPKKDRGKEAQQALSKLDALIANYAPATTRQPDELRDLVAREIAHALSMLPDWCKRGDIDDYPGTRDYFLKAADAALACMVKRKSGVELHEVAELESSLYHAEQKILELEGQPVREYVEAIPADQWHEDDGAVLWWRIPVEEPPYCGTPLDGAMWTEDYYTHFTRLQIPSNDVEDG